MLRIHYNECQLIAYNHLQCCGNLTVRLEFLMMVPIHTEMQWSSN